MTSDIEPTGPMAANLRVADMFMRVADLLQAQGANAFREAAYRHAAEVVRGLSVDVSTLAERKGLREIDKLPGVGWGVRAGVDRRLSGRIERSGTGVGARGGGDGCGGEAAEQKGASDRALFYVHIQACFTRVSEKYGVILYDC